MTLSIGLGVQPAGKDRCQCSSGRGVLTRRLGGGQKCKKGPNCSRSRSVASKVNRVPAVAEIGVKPIGEGLQITLQIGAYYRN
jgi:hypothetical protein